MTIQEVCTLWKTDRKRFIKASSYAIYLNHINLHIIPFFGSYTEVGENDVQRFVLELLGTGLAASTVRENVTVLKMIVKYGARNGQWPLPDWDIKYPSVSRRKEIEVLTLSEHKKIIDYIKRHLDERNAGIYICLSTGLRIGEVCALRWMDIDLERRQLHVRNTLERIYTAENQGSHTTLVMSSPKTANSLRAIPLTQDICKVLVPLLRGREKEDFVLSGSRHPLEPRTYRNYYHQYMRDAGLPDVRFHVLRHSFGTRCIESGCDYKTVSVLLGHSNISTTLNLYVHPNYEQKMKCMEKLQSFIN